MGVTPGAAPRPVNENEAYYRESGLKGLEVDATDEVILKSIRDLSIWHRSHGEARPHFLSDTLNIN